VKIAYSPNKLIKLFWTFSLLVSFGLTAYLILQSILSYLSFEVYTTSRTIFETPALFPKITICNYNPFATRYSIDFLRGINKLVRDDIDMFNLTQLDQMNYTDKTKFFADIYSSASSVMLGKNFTDDQRKQLGHNLEDILIECSFNGDTCTTDDFSWKFDNYFGNCFVFNSGFNLSGHRVDLKQSRLAGSLFGLKIKVYL